MPGLAWNLEHVGDGGTMDSRQLRRRTSGERGHHEVEMTLRRPRPTARPPVQSEAVLIHSDFVDELEGALDEGRDAFIALTQSLGRPNEEIASYVLVRDEDGAHHLPGIGCDSEDFLRERMGTHDDETLDSIIGVTSRKKIKQALLAQPGVA
jgi:hypothetical protein